MDFLPTLPPPAEFGITQTGLIQEFGRLLGFPDLALDENGLCLLSADNRWNLHLEAAPEGGIILSCEIGAIPQDPPSTLHRNLMHANFLLARAGGPVLALREPDDMLMLVSYVPAAHLELSELTSHFRTLLDLAPAWEETLLRLAAPADHVPISEDSLPEDALRI